MNKPNLFSFATSELSQDAFFAWLLSYADEQYKEHYTNLHQVAIQLLSKLLNLAQANYSQPIKSVQVKKQHPCTISKIELEKWTKIKEKDQLKKEFKGYIDLLITINDNFRILIESKTNSKEHGEQLLRYSIYAKNNNWDFIGIYLKTGEESNYYLNQIPEKTKLINHQFYICNRNEILSVLNQFQQIKNDIFQDYLNYLNQLHADYETYLTQKIGEWKNNPKAWQGFYSYLDKQGLVAWWDVVANLRGNFYAADCIYSTCSGYKTVFAIHQGKLIFGIFVDESDKRLKVRNAFQALLKKQRDQQGRSEIICNKRLGIGKFMKVAEIKQENWLGCDNEQIILSQVIAKLNEYCDFLKSLNKYSVQ